MRPTQGERGWVIHPTPRLYSIDDLGDTVEDVLKELARRREWREDGRLKRER